MTNKNRHTYIAAVYLILIKDDKILLSKRANTGYEDGNYSLVAGHMEGGETIKQAIIREAREEAGIEIDERNLEIVTFLHRNTNPERFDFFLGCAKWSGEITNAEPDKCSELSWYEIDNLPTNLVPCVRQAIKNYRHNIPFADFGWKKGE